MAVDQAAPLRVGDLLYVGAERDEFYSRVLDGWYDVVGVDLARARLYIQRRTPTRRAPKLKVYERANGFHVLLEHERDRDGRSTWDPVRGFHRWPSVAVRLRRCCEAPSMRKRNARSRPPSP